MNLVIIGRFPAATDTQIRAFLPADREVFITESDLSGPFLQSADAVSYTHLGLLDLAVEALESVREAAHLVDDAQGHCLLSIDHTANVGGHIVLFQHQGLELLSRDLAVAGDEGHDPILKPLEVVVGLGGGDDLSLIHI